MFVLLGFAFDSFWAAGYFIYSGITNEGDWALVILGKAPSMVWRAGLVAIGIVAYISSARAIGKLLAKLAMGEIRRLVMIPYFAAGVVACVAALFDFSDPIGALGGAARETFLANIVLFGVLRWDAGLQRSVRSAPSYITPSPAWLIGTGMAFILFVTVLGRGVRSNHGTPLPPSLNGVSNSAPLPVGLMNSRERLDHCVFPG